VTTQALQKSDFERYPPGMPMDETDINVRAYFWNLPDEKIAQYDPKWSDERVMEWDGNFKNDGSLMMACSERGVEIGEYREVLHQYLEFRKQIAASAGN
jgi:hypothetical protein